MQQEDENYIDGTWQPVCPETLAVDVPGFRLEMPCMAIPTSHTPSRSQIEGQGRKKKQDFCRCSAWRLNAGTVDVIAPCRICSAEYGPCRPASMSALERKMRLPCINHRGMRVAYMYLYVPTLAITIPVAAVSFVRVRAWYVHV